MEGIQVSVSATGPQDSISVIKVGGYIDTTTSAEVERSLDSILRESRRNIIIDLGNVDYISSAGWGIFISEIKGIREKGGDLKLVNMIPDVYEVFELLEFHYILKAFDSAAEAINDFEQNSQKSVQSPLIDDNSESGEDSADSMVTESDISSSSATKPSNVSSAKSKSTVEEKIKKLIMEKPDISVLDIKNSLNTENYDFTKVGILEIWSELRKMGLTSKKKRMEYFKKNAFQT